jgi:hypothetical protein
MAKEMHHHASSDIEILWNLVTTQLIVLSCNYILCPYY